MQTIAFERRSADARQALPRRGGAYSKGRRSIAAVASSATAGTDAQQRSPFADVVNRPQKTVAERRTNTWVTAHASPPTHPQSHPAQEKAALQNEQSGHGQASRKPHMSVGTPVVWHVDFAGEPVQADATSCKAGTRQHEHARAAGLGGSDANTDAQQQHASQPQASRPSQHPLAVPQPGGLTHMTQRRMHAIAAAQAPRAAPGSAAHRAASQMAATRSATLSPHARVYKGLPPARSRSGVPASPAAVKRLATRRRTAALAQLPCADAMAPSMRDLWRAEEHVVEVQPNMLDCSSVWYAAQSCALSAACYMFT